MDLVKKIQIPDSEYRLGSRTNGQVHSWEIWIEDKKKAKMYRRWLYKRKKSFSEYGYSKDEFYSQNMLPKVEKAHDIAGHRYPVSGTGIWFAALTDTVSGKISDPVHPPSK